MQGALLACLTTVAAAGGERVEPDLSPRATFAGPTLREAADQSTTTYKRIFLEINFFGEVRELTVDGRCREAGAQPDGSAIYDRSPHLVALRNENEGVGDGLIYTYELPDYCVQSTDHGLKFAFANHPSSWMKSMFINSTLQTGIRVFPYVIGHTESIAGTRISAYSVHDAGPGSAPQISNSYDTLVDVASLLGPIAKDVAEFDGLISVEFDALVIWPKGDVDDFFTTKSVWLRAPVHLPPDSKYPVLRRAVLDAISNKFGIDTSGTSTKEPVPCAAVFESKTEFNQAGFVQVDDDEFGLTTNHGLISVRENMVPFVHFWPLTTIRTDRIASEGPQPRINWEKEKGFSTFRMGASSPAILYHPASRTVTTYFVCRLAFTDLSQSDLNKE